MTHLIPFDTDGAQKDDAVNLVYNFLNDPELKKISDHSIGGTFPLADFKLGKHSHGKKFWYCYYANAKPPHPVLFLALEDSLKGWPRKMKPSEYPLQPEHETLLRPKTTFGFDDKKYDRKKMADVVKFIHSHNDPSDGVVKIQATEVRKHAWAFASQFGDNAGHYCEFPYAHFENYHVETRKCSLDEFVEQCGSKIKYVKYFFGLDNTKDKKGKYNAAPNRIRVVLFPVDANRLHIKTKKDNFTLANDVERSFPPD